jgi:hypothetical protein
LPQFSSFVQRLHLPPAWTLLLAIVADAGVSAWRAVNASAAAEPGFFLLSLVWPGVSVLLAVYVFAWLGWALDIG